MVERDEAVAHVARREHAKPSTERARTSAVIGHGDDAGDLVARAGVERQAFQDRRQPRAAAERHYTW